eukprot:RCo043800
MTKSSQKGWYSLLAARFWTLGSSPDDDEHTLGRKKIALMFQLGYLASMVLLTPIMVVLLTTSSGASSLLPRSTLVAFACFLWGTLASSIVVLWVYCRWVRRAGGLGCSVAGGGFSAPGRGGRGPGCVPTPLSP